MLNSYRIMWVFVFFDLPVLTKKERKAAAKFRKDLLKDGFGMMQYSVYIRHCASREIARMHVRRVKAFLPANGHVAVMLVTDKQYGMIENYWGASKGDPVVRPVAQLEMF